jgi:hypothetical protein
VSRKKNVCKICQAPYHYCPSCGLCEDAECGVCYRCYDAHKIYVVYNHAERDECFDLTDKGREMIEAFVNALARLPKAEPPAPTQKESERGT